MQSIAPIDVDHSKLEALCREYKVKPLAVFGSYLRGEQTPASDLDLLVEFEQGKMVGLFGLMRLQRNLGDEFQKTIDLNTAGFLNKAFRKDVIQDSQTIYAG